MCLVVTSVRRILESGGPENFRIVICIRKRSSLRFSLFFCPILGEDQNKKRSSPRFSPIFCPNSKRGGDHDSILRTIIKYLCIPSIPKGGGMALCPFKYATARGYQFRLTLINVCDVILNSIYLAKSDVQHCRNFQFFKVFSKTLKAVNHPANITVVYNS